MPAFHGARSQQGYGLGGMFRWAMPHLRQRARVLGKKALKTGVNVAQDVIEGKDVKRAVRKRAKQALSDITSQNSPQEQSGGGQKVIKRKAHLKNISSPPSRKGKTTPPKQQQGTFKLLLGN